MREQRIEDAFAVAHLVVEDVQVVLLFRIAAIVAHFADDDRHGGERRAQFMCRAGGLRAQ